MPEKILQLAPGDRLELKKPHPCGGKIFLVHRAASDVRVICETCGRDMVLDRLKLERAVRAKLPPKNQE